MFKKKVEFCFVLKLKCFIILKRYIFKDEKKVGIQELGPRFSLKLRSLQKGTFDSKYGEYEWVLKVSLPSKKSPFIFPYCSLYEWNNHADDMIAFEKKMLNICFNCPLIVVTFFILLLFSSVMKWRHPGGSSSFDFT